MKKLMFLALLAAAGCGDGVTATSGAAACNTAAACGILPGGNIIGISACTQFIQAVNEPEGANFVHIDPDEVNCLAEAGSDCDRARACLNYGQTAASCSGTSQMCDGNTWVSCDGLTGINGNNGTRRFKCSSLNAGASCLVANGQADCGYATCAIGFPTCDGDVLETCTTGIRQRYDCGRTNSTCVPGAGLSQAHCRGTGPGCSGTGNLRCDGTFVVSCSDGQEARYDCKRQNLGCFEHANTRGVDCALGEECDPADFAAECNGLKLTYCNKGRRSQINCGDYGFNGCTPNMGGRCTKS
jgi:hypothetical protein